MTALLGSDEASLFSEERVFDENGLGNFSTSFNASISSSETLNLDLLN